MKIIFRRRRTDRLVTKRVEIFEVRDARKVLIPALRVVLKKVA